MKSEKDEIPASRVWIKVNDLNSAIEAWTKIQRDILDTCDKVESADFDEV